MAGSVKIGRYRPQVGTPQGGISPGDPRLAHGPNLGTMLGDVAAVVTGVAAQREQNKRDEQQAIGTAWAANFLAETQSAAAREQARLQLESGEGGTGVVAGMKAFFDARATLATEQAPGDTSRQFTETQLLDLRTQYDIKSFGFESDRRKEWSLVTQSKAVEEAADAAAADYANAPQIAAVQVASINANPLLSPAEKRSRAVEATELIAYSAGLAHGEYDPYAARRDIRQSLRLDPNASTDDIALERDSAIDALEKIEELEGVSVPDEQRADAVAALMVGGGVSVDKASGEVKITRGDVTNAGKGPWVYEALSVPRRIELLSKADAEIARRENEAKQRAEQGRVALAQKHADTMVALKSGDPVSIMSLPELSMAFGPERGALAYREQQIAQANAGTIAAMSGMTSVELAAVPANAPTGTTDRQFRQETYAIRADAAARELAAREADPGGRVLAASPGVQESFALWQRAAQSAAEPGADENAPQRVIDAQSSFVRSLFAEQRRLGYAKTGLPTAFVEGVARQFDESMKDDPEVAARTLESVAITLLDEPEALAQLDEKVSTLGKFAFDGVPGLTLRRLQEQAKITDAQRRDALAARGATPTDVEEAVTGEFAALVATFAGRPMAAETQARYLDAGKALAADALMNGRASSAEEAASLAYTDLYGERNVVMEGLRIPITRDYTPESVVTGLRAYLPHAGALAENVIEPGVTPTETRAATTRALMRNGRWITNDNGDGAYLFFGGDAVRDEDGIPIEVKYSDAALIRPPVQVPRVPRAGHE